MRTAILLALFALIFSGCASKHYDYAAFLNSSPKSVLVLPPVGQSNDIKASAGVGASIIQPLCEDGYYVFPLALVKRHSGKMAYLSHTKWRKSH